LSTPWGSLAAFATIITLSISPDTPPAYVNKTSSIMAALSPRKAINIKQQCDHCSPKKRKKTSLQKVLQLPLQPCKLNETLHNIKTKSETCKGILPQLHC
jgi:hypothetical protein